jgi:hypothetical protein
MNHSLPMRADEPGRSDFGSDEPTRGGAASSGAALSGGRPRAGAKHPSPPLLLLTAVHVALFVAGLVVSTIAAGGAVFPSPFQPELARAYFAAHSDAVELASFFVFGSAIPLGLFGATVSSRLRFLGVDVAGVTIALCVGIGASLMLLLAGIAMWVLAQAGVADVPASARLLHLVAFGAGGPAFSAMFGLLVAGVSLAGGITRRLPKWLMWFGLAIAVVAELSTLSLLVDGLAFLLPAARFPGLGWLIWVGVLMPRSRAPRAEARNGEPK